MAAVGGSLGGGGGGRWCRPRGRCGRGNGCTPAVHAAWWRRTAVSRRMLASKAAAVSVGSGGGCTRQLRRWRRWRQAAVAAPSFPQQGCAGTASAAAAAASASAAAAAAAAAASATVGKDARAVGIASQPAVSTLRQWPRRGTAAAARARAPPNLAFPRRPHRRAAAGVGVAQPPHVNRSPAGRG